MALEPDDRVEEEIGGTKRLQTERPNRADKARVLVSFHVSIPLAERREYAPTPGDLDAVTIMRARVADYDSTWPREAKLRLISDLLDYADMEVEVAK